MNRATSPSVAHCNALQVLDPDAPGIDGRSIVVRSPSERVMAAGSDCLITRVRAKRWLRCGLALAFVARVNLDHLALLGQRRVFSSRRPIGEVLSPKMANVALSAF